MAFLILLYSFMAIGLHVIIAAPVSENTTFYTAINGICPNSSELLTKQKEIFTNCQNLEKINQGLKITNSYAQSMLCLLYYSRITSYCLTKPQQLEYPTLAEVISKDYEPLDICQNINEYSNITIKEIACFHLCTDIEGNIHAECLLSHYYYDRLKNPASLTTPAGVSTNLSAVINPAQVTELKGESEALKHLKDPVLNKPTNPKEENQIIAQTPNNVQGVGDVRQEKPATDIEVNNPKLDKHADNHQGQSAADDSQTNGETQGKPDDQRTSIDENHLISNGDKDTQQQPMQNPNQLPANKTKSQQLETEKLNTPKAVNQPPIQNAADIRPPEKSTELKPVQNPVPVQKPVEDVPNGAIDVPVDIKAADETKQKNQPKLENVDADIDDAEGQHGEDYADGENLPEDNMPQPAPEAKQEISEKKPDILQGNPINSDNIDEIDGESYFMTYFMVVCILVVLGYVGYHNRIKVMALLLEGKRSRRPYRGRRPNSANYHKLDSNLEEAISSNVTKNSNNVIY